MSELRKQGISLKAFQINGMNLSNLKYLVRLIDHTEWKKCPKKREKLGYYSPELKQNYQPRLIEGRSQPSVSRIILPSSEVAKLAGTIQEKRYTVLRKESKRKVAKLRT